MNNINILFDDKLILKRASCVVIMDPAFMIKIRYGDEDEAYEALCYVFEKILNEFEDDPSEGFKKIKAISLRLLETPRAKIKKAVFRALAKIGFYDKELFEKAYEILLRDPDFEVRKKVEESIIEILKRTQKKKEALKDIIKAITEKGIRLSPVDVVKAVGIDVAKSLMNELENEEKNIIEFAIKESSMQ